MKDNHLGQDKTVSDPPTSPDNAPPSITPSVAVSVYEYAIGRYREEAIREMNDREWAKLLGTFGLTSKHATRPE